MRLFKDYNPGPLNRIIPSKDYVEPTCTISTLTTTTTAPSITSSAPNPNVGTLVNQIIQSLQTIINWFLGALRI